MFSSKEETQPSVPGTEKNRVLTVGRAINCSIFIIFLCVAVAALVVVGTLGVSQQKVTSHPEPNTSHHSCILYSHCPDGPEGQGCMFNYSRGFSCEFVLVGYSFVALVAVVFLVVTCVRLILGSDLWMTVFVETFVMVSTIVAVFVMGVVLSIGIFITCRSIKDFYKAAVNTCDRRLPYNNTRTRQPGPLYYGTLNHSQAAAWLCFAFLIVLLVINVLRVIVYVRRRKKAKELGGEVLTAEDNVADKVDKPI